MSYSLSRAPLLQAWFSSGQAGIQQLASVSRKVLVANRGEIACRVLQTAKRLGIPTVAVYSKADRASLHVQHANEAFCIGPPAARDSYLRMDRILEVALRTGSEAVHPGYGFLSENTTFAGLCEDNGIAFIGPPASAIAAMGNKSEAKALMAAAGVPVVPGYHGDDQDESLLLEEGHRIGFPLLVKAVLGGGGKGMKLANSAEELPEALSSAKREAAAAFGDERVLLEHYITRPRHIEVQIFADTLGNAVYLFERDCSMQRRHQKVIEEAPAPGISEDFRRSIGEAAVAAARAVGYVNAGTVEFIVDTDTGDYHFMEMNTRLQVEHPVTEAITGQDLVEWQLRVAAGQRLPILQHQLKILGHAFEARLYAESPERGFLPGTGTLQRWHVPPGAVSFNHHGAVRVDSGVRAGDQVGVHYDPMIAKLITKGPDRQTALDNLHTALSQLQVSGLPTNVRFLKRLAMHPSFVAAELDTSFIAKHLDSLTEAVPPPVKVVAMAAIARHLLTVQAAEREAAGKSGSQLGAWAVLDSFRLNHEVTSADSMTHTATSAACPVHLTFHRDRSVSVKVSGECTQDVVVAKMCKLSTDGTQVEAEIDGERLTADLSLHDAGDEQVLTVWMEGEAYAFSKPVPRKWARSGAIQSSAGLVTSPMPGKIIKVLVGDGDEVEEGAALVVLEAMKMEHTVRAPRPGTVAELAALPGAQVADGAVLAVIAPSQQQAAAAGEM
ncbi:g4064 [Coccomyxa elongata]